MEKAKSRKKITRACDNCKRRKLKVCFLNDEKLLNPYY